MAKRIDRVLINRRTIADRVEEIAHEIADDIRREVGDARVDAAEPADVTLVPLLTGSVIFLADLIRHLPLMMRIGMIGVSSYPGKATRSRGVSITSALPVDLTGHHVTIIDDILDSGRTITAVRAELEKLNPASIKVCVLLRKKTPQARAIPVDYVGFDIDDEFVVGYGLDYDGYYRNLPEVVTLTEEAMA